MGEAGEKAWHTSVKEDIERTTHSAIQSARSLRQDSSYHLRSLQDFLPQLKSQYVNYEDAFFKKVKDVEHVANKYLKQMDQRKS